MTSLYDRPDFQTLKQRVAADLAAVPAVLRVPLAAALAKLAHGEHGHLDWIAKQCSPLACEEERLYDWAALYDVERLATTAASGTAAATGSAGAQLLAGATLRANNGLDYTVTAAVTLGAGATPVALRCAAVGSDGNLSAGQLLTLVDPVPGVASTLTVSAGQLAGGADLEDIDAWRARVVDEWQTVTTLGARAGKPADYVYWAKSAHPSVTGALVQLHTLGLGTVIVRPICNALANRLPTEQVLNAVIAKLTAVAPAGADWRVVAPIVRGVNIGLALLPAVDTTVNRAAIVAAIKSAILAEVADDSVLSMAEIDAVVATVTTQYTRLAPLASIAVGPGEVLVFDGVAWA